MQKWASLHDNLGHKWKDIHNQQQYYPWMKTWRYIGGRLEGYLASSSSPHVREVRECDLGIGSKGEQLCWEVSPCSVDANVHSIWSTQFFPPQVTLKKKKERMKLFLPLSTWICNCCSAVLPHLGLTLMIQTRRNAMSLICPSRILIDKI